MAILLPECWDYRYELAQLVFILLSFRYNFSFSSADIEVQMVDKNSQGRPCKSLIPRAKSLREERTCPEPWAW